MGIAKIFLFSLLIFVKIDARPISYQGGSTLISISDNMKDSLYYHYSPSHKYSLGLESVDDKFFDKKYTYIRLTYLLNRKNTKHSQRNLYFQSGMSLKNNENSFYGMHGDWETRRLFAGFGYKEIAYNINNYVERYYQIGFAPYLGEYGDLHTWLMIKRRKNTLTGGWNNYPIIKFFKGNFLVEFGYDSKTNWDFQMIYRF